MKKIIYLLPLMAIACKKTEKISGPRHQYTCACETKIEFVDHCGRDSSISLTNIYASNRAEADETCWAGNSKSADTYSITTKTCALQ